MGLLYGKIEKKCWKKLRLKQLQALPDTFHPFLKNWAKILAFYF